MGSTFCIDRIYHSMGAALSYRTSLHGGRRPPTQWFRCVGSKVDANSMGSTFCIDRIYHSMGAALSYRTSLHGGRRPPTQWFRCVGSKVDANSMGDRKSVV